MTVATRRWAELRARLTSSPLCLWLIGTCALGLATLVLWIEGADSARQRLELVADHAARRSAQVVSQRLAQALEAGVPLERLEGLPELLLRQLRSSPEVAQLCVRTVPGSRELASQPRPCLGRSPGVQAVVVELHGQAVAEVLARRAPVPLAQPQPLQIAALVLAIAAVLAIGHEVARAALVRGPLRRHQVLSHFAAGLAHGRLDRIVPPSTTRRRDPDIAALRAELRSVHEERLRLRRLLDVLHASETVPAMQARLDAMRAEIDGDDRFADGALAVEPVPDEAPRGLWPWLGRLVIAAAAAGAAAWGGWHVAWAAGGVAVAVAGPLVWRRRDLARAALAGGGLALALRLVGV